MADVLTDVQALLQKHFSLAPDQVEPEQKLADLGVDSLSTIEFMFELENAFGISLTDFRGSLDTVGDIAAMVEGALAVKEQAD